jgi:hypothetical protein
MTSAHTSPSVISERRRCTPKGSSPNIVTVHRDEGEPMKNEHIVGLLLGAVLAGGLVWQARTDAIDSIRAELRSAEGRVELAEADALRDFQRSDACGRVLRRAPRLIEAQAKHLYRLYDDDMPALVQEAFELGTRRDEEELFFGVIRGLDDQRRLQQFASQDLRAYGWAPTSSLAKGDENLAAVCLGVSEESLYRAEL